MERLNSDTACMNFIFKSVVCDGIEKTLQERQIMNTKGNYEKHHLFIPLISQFL